MTGLVYATGAFVILSGSIKLFGKSRIPGAVQLFPLLEVLAGAGALLGAMALDTESTAVIALVALPLTIAIVSTANQVRTTKANRRRREESEGARLATYVEILADQPEDEAPPSLSPESE